MAFLMCPSFRVSQDDPHGARGRAGVLRDALHGSLGDRFSADGSPDAARDLCVGCKRCKGCKGGCPNGIGRAALRAETPAPRRADRAPPWTSLRRARSTSPNIRKAVQ